MGAGLLGQTWTLTSKTLLIVLGRHWLSTTVRAFLAPIVFIFFISYARNFFVPPSDFGIGSPSPVRDLQDAFAAGIQSRRTVAFVNSGFTGGAIASVIADLSQQVTSLGRQAVVVQTPDELLAACPSSLRGVSNCFGGVTFHSSPDQGGLWNYTLHGDGALGNEVYVDRTNNDAEVYTLPWQRAVDQAILRQTNQQIPQPQAFPYTSETNDERDADITRRYQDTLLNILALAYFIGMVGVCYQLVGEMAKEREIGMSQLIEAMMPNKRRWQPQVARIVSNHLAFDIIYVLGWIIMGAIIAGLVFPDSSAGILIVFNILAGLSLTSYSIFIASFFRKAQLSGIISVLVSILLAIIAQLGSGKDASTGAVGVLSFVFPPVTYTYFMMYCASFQRFSIPVNLSEDPPLRPWRLSGTVFFVFLVLQTILFPILGALVERALYSTASSDRKLHIEGAAVRLTNFCKTFSPGRVKRLFGYKDEVRAVQDLNLEIPTGQIMILLGANGSGKSTTLDAICGLSKVSSGEIEIDGRGGIGLCPQKNVLWDELTVFEHVRIFNRLKGDSEAKGELRELISSCDLDSKVHAKAKTLSGGQKRKLQLAMMFTGGSRVCCVDEVSSGIDPLARRKVWDILLAERGHRTIILTTHFLDEADVLSDHIAIMSKGVLKAQGSAVALKHTLGGGYRVYVKDRYEALNMEHTHDYDQNVYALPDTASTAAFIRRLDASGIEYRVQGPTVEDVFLKMADEIKDDFEKTKPETDSMDSNAPVVAPMENRLDLVSGNGTTLLRQAWVLFLKRLVVLQHNFLPYVAAVIIPVIAAGMVTLFLVGQDRLSCDPSSVDYTDDYTQFTSLISPDLVAGPPNLVPVDLLQRAFPTLNGSSLSLVDSVAALEDYVRANYSTVSPGAVYLDPPFFAWQASGDFGFAILAFSVLAQNILDSVLGNVTIAASYQPFAIPFAPQAGDTLQVILYFGLAMCAYTGFFALYPTAERLRKVRALHYSNGVRSVPLWLAYVAFDFLFVLFVSILAIALWVGLWSHWYYPGHLFVVFFLYGLASIAMAYAVSLFVPSQLAAFAFTAGAQAALFLLYFIAYLVIITYSPVDKIDDYVTIAHFTIATITPSGNLLRALLLTLNEFSLVCDGRRARSYGGDIMTMGGPILYLTLQFVVVMAFVIWWDGGGRLVLWRRSHKIPEDSELKETRDPEVFEEVNRIEGMTDGLRAKHLNKAFGASLAVEDVTFGISKGESFALLGPNGAGKSTTISLIRGDIRPSFNQSDVLVEGSSIMRNREAARNSMGVTPQFDAMDQMTVIDHLRFYARVRGVPDVERNVREIMRAVGIQVYANRMAEKLSGGNKRKLSLAIALTGNPAVLLLDEPSSGMDAAAKRVMWRVLGSITAGRALLITTHSMEEADALASRAGILAGRMLALGPIETLRQRHGNAYHVHIVHRDAPHTADADMERIQRWVMEFLPHARMDARTYHGQLRFSVPQRPEDSISGLFGLLEQYKPQLGFAYYSVQPTTLDQVFLNVVRRHNIAEENYALAHSGQRASAGRRAWNKVVRIMGNA